MSDKQRWPLKEAVIIAETLREVLALSCERIIIAGSIRRQKADVGYIELLYIPRFEPRKIDLLNEAKVNVTDECINKLIACGQLAKRKNKNGSEMWGEKNKLAVHIPTGIPVDLFATDADSWWNNLVCRTGPAESNMRIAQAAQKRGWQWNPYQDGFTTPNGFIHCGTERYVFEAVGLPYYEPRER